MIFLSKLCKELESSFEKQQYSQGIVFFVNSLEDKLDKKDETKSYNKIKFGLDKGKRLTPENTKEDEKILVIIVLFMILFFISLPIVFEVSERLKRKK